MAISKSKHRIIGIVSASMHDSGAQNTMLALINEAEKRGYKVVVITNFTYYHMEYSHAEMDIFELINSPLLEGLIVMPESIKSASLWEKVLKDIKASGLPFVCIDRDVPDCVSITFDYGKAFEQVMRHMIEVHKPERINFIGGMENNSFSEERLNVFKKVLSENGREFDPERFGYGQFWESPTLEVLDKFYSSDLEPPDAILCVNDAEAMTVCNYLRKKGLDVPNDVIVNGFDGIEEEKYTFPRLTTAAMDLEGMAEKAFDLIGQLVRGEQPSPRLTVIPYTLRVSQSCGCMKIDEGDKVNKLLELYISRKNNERHERRMFEYAAHTGSINTYSQLAELMPIYTECPTWVCLENDILHDADTDHEEKTRDKTKVRLFTQSYFDEEQDYDTTLPTGSLLPKLDLIFDKYNALLFAPLSYQDESMGYLATAIDSDGFDFLFTQRFVSNTNQIFETLKTKIRLQKAYAEVADMHMRDPMTGIYNRRGFYMQMAELAEKCSDRFCLFSVDLDRLKYINDTFGHYAGDKAIIMSAEIVKRVAGQGAVCARFGGDEFVVVIPEENDAGTYIDRVNEEIKRFNASKKEPFEISLSMGTSELRITDRENIDIAMKAADIKMYECKRRHHAERK